MSKHFNMTGKLLSLSAVIIILTLLIANCEGPTGGDFERPYVTFLNIDQSGEVIDDTLYFSTEINLTASDNDELDKVELYIYNLDPADTSKIIPIKTFTGNPPYSYVWETDTGNGLASGQYKFIAGAWDKVGYYYQEFRTVLLRGDSAHMAAVIGTLTDINGAPLKDAYVSIITSNQDTLAKNTGVSLSGGNYSVVNIPISANDTSIYAKANYNTDTEIYTFYYDQKLNMQPSKSYIIDFGISDIDENYDYLKISNISHSTTQIVEVDTATGKSDSINFQFDYDAWVSQVNPLTPVKDAWLVISANNDEYTDSTSMAINLGSIGFKPGISNTVNFNIKAPSGSFPDDVYKIYAAVVVYAASESEAYDKFDLFYLREQRIIRIGNIKIQWK